MSVDVDALADALAEWCVECFVEALIAEVSVVSSERVSLGQSVSAAVSRVTASALTLSTESLSLASTRAVMCAWSSDLTCATAPVALLTTAVSSVLVGATPCASTPESARAAAHLVCPSRSSSTSLHSFGCNGCTAQPLSLLSSSRTSSVSGASIECSTRRAHCERSCKQQRK